MSWFEEFPASRISNELWLGNYANATQVARENPDGITAILNVHDEALWEFNPTVKYFHVPFLDGHEVPEDALVSCMVIMSCCMRDKKRMLIHCAAGISRSPTMMAAFFHVNGIAHFNIALERIKEIRPIVGPAPLVLSSVRKLLGVYPYDGSFNDAESGQEKKIRDLITEKIRDFRYS